MTFNTSVTKLETATFGGGCFWCTEAIFKRLNGVVSVVSGYSGGFMENPDYESVSGGFTNHAEAIQVVFDKSIILYEKLLEIFFHLHDPTTRNQQGNDVGTQYRSVIFYHSVDQKKIAEKVKEKVGKSNYYKNPIVTEILQFEAFYKAEDYHQNYYDNNKSYPYCTIVINPKVNKLLREYRNEVKEEFKEENK